MFLQLNHQKLDVYFYSKQFILEFYKITKVFPSEERFSMCSQIRRVALSVHLNIADGGSRKSDVEQKRYFEISRDSIIEIDAAINVAYELKYFENYNTENLSSSMINALNYYLVS
jgi:four helix bundle protein